MTKILTNGDTSREWKKSSYSTNEGPQYIEVCRTASIVRVRDSKDSQGPQLTFSAAAWQAFIAFTTDFH